MTAPQRRRGVAAALAIVAALIAPASHGAGIPDAAASISAALVGNTLSGVLFLPHEAAKGETLDRVVFQAYLRPDGSALMRRWEPAHNAYTAVAEQRWSVAGNTLCLDFSLSADVPRLCVEVHVWGPRIAGNTTGAGRFAMLDANVEPGNTLIAAR